MESESPSLPGKLLRYHVVAIPYLGRGHINPLLNFCKLIASSRADILVTFIVTEEWLGFLSSETKPENVRFGSIPNVVPSELVRGADPIGFYKALLTKVEAPVEELLDRLEIPASLIVYDTFLTWVLGVGNRRNIPLASFWTQSAAIFSMFSHYDTLVAQIGADAAADYNGGDMVISRIPGVPPTELADLPTPFNGKGREILNLIGPDLSSSVNKVQYILLSTIFELESQVIDVLKAKLHPPIYSIGLAIPHFHPEGSREYDDLDYFKWLDDQPKSSVLYISQGSFLSVRKPQLDEIIAGVHDSGVRYLRVGRGERIQSIQRGSNDDGLVVPWCDQLKVLCHPSVGGFWSHCGWNSVKESVFAGVPMLTFPLILDQVHNSKVVVQDWKIGWSVKKTNDAEVVGRGDISGLVSKFMDVADEEVKEMRRRAEKLRDICRQATGKGGSSETNFDAFIGKISQQPGYRKEFN